jgi:hypothetical protein
MFETLKMNLSKKIDAGTELTRIRAKLHKFLTNNADVDHYLCDEQQKAITRGFILGIAIALLCALLFILILISYWHNMGYLNIPGMRW